MLSVGIWHSTALASSPPPDVILKKAKAIIHDIDYLPFAVKEDGCYARALYMGMELVAHGIPAMNQYIFGALKPTKGITWNYHVASMVSLGDGNRYVIFDPSFYDAPMTPKFWIAQSRPHGKLETYVAPASHYRKNQVQELSEQGKRGYSLKSRIRKVQALPKYQIKNIADACMTVWEHIGYEDDLKPAEKAAKRAKLGSRTLLLIERLKTLHVLDKGSQLTSCKDGTSKS